MRKFLQITLLLFAAGTIQAQTDAPGVLGFDEFMTIVRTNHPVAKQAELEVLRGEANLLKSQGLFDPQAFTKVSQKYFDGTQYYSNIDGGLRLPTWFGVELKSGYEQNQGAYLDPESTTPGAGLWYAGVSVPVGRGLFIDKRRAELRNAKTFLDITESERQLMLNDLLFKSGKVYWDWFLAYNTMLVYVNAKALAEQRFEAVKQAATLGDRPFVDTLEAGIQVQNRAINLFQAELDYANTTGLLEVYLWAEGIIPLELAEGTLPQPMETVAATPVQGRYYLMLDSLGATHPALAQYDSRIQQLRIDKRLKQEQLKPKLNLNYNPLSEPVGGAPLAAYSIHNYKWGLQFSMPIFLRKERAELQLAKLKIQDTQLDSDLANTSLAYRASVSLNEWSTSMEQVEVYVKTVADYQSLLEAERQLFNAGESSLFMVNSRELGYINGQTKLIAMQAKNKKASLAASYAFGTLWNN